MSPFFSGNIFPECQKLSFHLPDIPPNKKLNHGNVVFRYSNFPRYLQQNGNNSEENMEKDGHIRCVWSYRWYPLMPDVYKLHKYLSLSTCTCWGDLDCSNRSFRRLSLITSWRRICWRNLGEFLWRHIMSQQNPVLNRNPPKKSELIWFHELGGWHVMGDDSAFFNNSPKKTSSTQNLRNLHPGKLTWNPPLLWGLEKETPFKDGNSRYLCQISGV